MGFRGYCDVYLLWMTAGGVGGMAPPVHSHSPPAFRELSVLAAPQMVRGCWNNENKSFILFNISLQVNRDTRALILWKVDMYYNFSKRM